MIVQLPVEILALRDAHLGVPGLVTLLARGIVIRDALVVRVPVVEAVRAAAAVTAVAVEVATVIVMAVEVVVVVVGDAATAVGLPARKMDVDRVAEE